MTRSWESKGMSEDSAHVEIDERAPSWVATLDKEEFHAELDLVCHAEWSSSLRRIRLRPVKEHINRCTFEIAIETTLGLGVRRPLSSQQRRKKYNILNLPLEPSNGMTEP